MTEDVARPSTLPSDLKVLAVVADAPSCAVITKVIPGKLSLTEDLTQAVTLAEQERPDIAFVEVDIHDGAGLALVHHLKAVVPTVTVYALSSKQNLAAAANAIALGGTGLIIMPPAGDEILSALESVRAKLADAATHTELDRTAKALATAASVLKRGAALIECRGRTAAAVQIVELVVEVMGAREAAVYTLSPAHDPAPHLSRIAASGGLLGLPRVAGPAELDAYVTSEGLRELLLRVGSTLIGRILVSQPKHDGGVLLEALLAQAAGAVAMLADREPSSSAATEPTAIAFTEASDDGEQAPFKNEPTGGSSIKDPASSAYSFAYYVDVAGREIARSQRYLRQFAIASVAFEVGPDARVPPMSHAEMADQLLKAARDTDVLAQVDEHEFHLLMPETDGLDAHAARRRILARIAERGGRALPEGLLIGVATFPHDGTDLSQLLRVARRRAEATRYSLVRRFAPDQSGLSDLVAAVGWDLEATEPGAIFAARHIDLPVTEAAALGGAIVAEAIRGGAGLIVVAANDHLGLGSSVRAALPLARDRLTVHAVDVRGGPDGEAIEAVAVLAEHGSYALVGVNERGLIRGIHAADPLLADVVAERLGRAAGLRLLS